MTTYTAVADKNGDFTVPFSSAYTGGERITVTAEKDGAVKTIELSAPSEFVGSGVIQFTSLESFPVNAGQVVIGDGLTAIGSNAFYSTTPIDSSYPNWMYRAKSLKIADSVITIGGSAFYRWSGSGALILPQALTSIGEQCFYGATRLNGQLDIPQSVKTIGVNAFNGCAAITKIVIGSGVTSIGTGAFINMSNLKEVYVTKLTPPAAGGNILGNAHSTLKIYVPASALVAYQAAEGWSAFAAKMEAY